MPKDEWAASNRRAAIRRGERDSYLNPKPKRHGKRHQANQANRRDPEPVYCTRCKSVEVDRSKRQFKDGTTHVEVRCAKCRTFIKWEAR